MYVQLMTMVDCDRCADRFTPVAREADRIWISWGDSNTQDMTNANFSNKFIDKVTFYVSVADTPQTEQVVRFFDRKVSPYLLLLAINLCAF
jgi:hypothetical protein